MNRERKKMYPSYSIAIRTLGTAGEKYRKLLDSIERQTIKPEKIVVVLPEGYQLPNEQLGYEQFEFSPKGMIIQRMDALKYIGSEYILFCDDDLEFDSDFCEKTISVLSNGAYDCASGPLLELFPPKGLKYSFASILGGACVMLHGRNEYYVRILNTGGWSYNRSIDIHSHRVYKTESLPWACFMIKVDVMKAIRFEDELWAERSGYSAFEDRVMFYKLLVNGYRTCVVSDAHYIHNDARSSTKGTRLKPVYAGAFNHYVFWHRFLYKPCKSIPKRFWKRLCIHYYVMMSLLYGWGLRMIKRRTVAEQKAALAGFQDAKKYVHSEEYERLPEVKI